MSIKKSIDKPQNNIQGNSKTHSKKRTVLNYFLIGCGTVFSILISIIIWIVASVFWGPDIMDLNSFHPFRSESAKKEYLTHYDKGAEKWPVSSITKEVETSYGRTFLRISGPDNAPPLVLLPGGGCNSLIWIPIIKDLSENYKTYSIDNIYDFGRSVYTRPMTETEDLLVWLDELFDKLKLEKDINLIGLSYGGWLASQYSLHSPSRLKKVVLIAPAATIFNFPPEFIKHMIIGVIPHRYFLRKAVYWVSEDAIQNSIIKKYVDDHVENVYLGMRSFKFKQPPSPTVLSDDEMRSINVPMLFLVGENEKLYNAEKAVQRIKSISPNIKTEIIPNCGHDLWIASKEIVNSRILKFLNEE